MATITTGSHSIGNYGWIRGYGTYSTSETNTAVTVSMSALGEQLGSNSSYADTYQISGSYAVSATVGGLSLGSYSGSATRSHSVSSSSPYYFDYDGGTTKSQTFNKTTSAQTKTLSISYTCGSDSARTASVTITIPALAKYTTTYNANNGTSGSVTSQTHYYGQAFTVSASANPTRQGYNFLGWSTSSTATTPTYTAGNSYTVNASETWYAVWELAAPTISNLKAIRVASSSSTTEYAEGTYAYVTFDRSGSVAPTSVSVTINGSTQTASTSGTSGSVALWFSGMATGNDYTVTATVTDSNGTTTATCVLSKSAYPIDIDPVNDTIDINLGVNINGSPLEAFVIAQGTYGSTWQYRVWSNGFQEVWYKGSITFSSAASSIGGWYRMVQNFTIPISSMSGMSAFDDDSVVTVSGAYSGRMYTTGGIKTSGTQFEAQVICGSSQAAGTFSGWNVYISGYERS